MAGGDPAAAAGRIPRGRLPVLALLALGMALAGCSPRLQPLGPDAFARSPAGSGTVAMAVPGNPGASGSEAGETPYPQEAADLVVPGPGRIDGDRLLLPDGTALPLRTWRPAGEPWGVVVALHGFNDHGRAFEMPGAAWAEGGLLVLAYDQRGFGASEHRGVWPGWERMAADFWAAVAAAKAEHPGLPVFAVGESMGGAVILSGFSPPMQAARLGAGSPVVAGVILSAPAVWGRSTMPAAYRWGLWFFAHALPWHPVSGSGLRRRASDNDEALRQLWEDPLTIRHTRTDSVWGLVNLMDAALASAGRIDVPVLTLYGERDEIVPPGPVDRMVRSLPETAEHRRYPDGWHLLFRDLNAAQVWQDTIAWMHERVGADGPLPAQDHSASEDS